MGKTLILNSSNIVNSSNAVFQYNFPQGGFTFKNDIIALESLSMYFSAFNITTLYNNNSFSYIWVDGSTWNVPIPNSYLQITDLNSFFQSYMYGNGHYLTTTNGNIVYLMELVVNQARYAVQLNNFLISVGIATANSWTIAPTATWVLPTNPILPYFIVPNNNFGALLGFSPGQYPSSNPNGVITATGANTPPAQIQTPAYTESQSTLSSVAPQITPYSSFLVFCSLVNNKAVIPSQLIYSFTPTNATFGALQTYQPTAELPWNRIVDGQYNSFTIEIRDQVGNIVQFKDPNSLITLYTKNMDNSVIEI